MSASCMTKQTAPQKPFLTSKFFEHLYDDDIPKYGQSPEIMRRLYGWDESGQPSTQAVTQGCTEICSDKASEDHAAYSLPTDAGAAKVAEHSRLPIRSAFLKMKNTLKAKAGSGTADLEVGLARTRKEDKMLSRAGSLRAKMPRKVSIRWSKPVAT